MRNLDVLNAACALICEAVGTSDDYESRAPYIIGTFLRTCKQVDRDWRLAHGMEPTPAYGNYPPMSDNFPFVDELSPAATYYLAAMLAMDENSELYEKLYDLFTDAVATVAASIPVTTHPIKQVY